MLYRITDTDDTGAIVARQHIEAPNADEARRQAGSMPTLTRHTKPLPGCRTWGAMVVAIQ